MPTTRLQLATATDSKAEIRPTETSHLLNFTLGTLLTAGGYASAGMSGALLGLGSHSG
jgi:hypothetical protein